MNGIGRKSTAVEITIKNFGPVQSGKMQLKPLTLFMGSNNTGKSWVAMVVYSILSGSHQSVWALLHSRLMDKSTQI